MTPTEFGRLFETFERSAFRLETLQQYLVPSEEEAFRAFREGLAWPPRTVDTSPWLRRVADNGAAGKRMYRVHIVDEPLTPYMRFEFETYRGNVAAGEEIYIARRADLGGYALRDDWWAFDLDDPERAVVVAMDYDEDGRYLGARRVPDAQLDLYREVRDYALEHAVPLHEYVAAAQRRSA